LLYGVTAAAGVVPDAEGAEAPSAEAMLAEALEANLADIVSAAGYRLERAS